jgi:integrase
MGISFRSAEKQADHAVRGITTLGSAGQDAPVRSIGTQRNYTQALKGLVAFLQEHHLGDLSCLRREVALVYLEARSQEVGQKTLDLDRQAIQAVLGERLEVVESERQQALESRAYTPGQIGLVAGAQSGKHALATMIAADAGLRAHEILTLLPVDERPATMRRQYRADRFSGRMEVEVYTVVGKGGLTREVAIERALARQLEACRLGQPRAVFDRVRYEQHYALGGGKQWSDSFSKAAKRELGWSRGAHGVRHSFAQRRMETLIGKGYAYAEALQVVSQEMGHFRSEITEVYLR